MTSVLRAGDLDHVLEIQRVTSTVDEFRTPVETWATVYTVRAKRLRASWDERNKDWGDSGQGTITWRIRYLPDLTLADRIVFSNVTHDIKNITPIGRHDALEVTTLAQK